MKSYQVVLLVLLGVAPICLAEEACKDYNNFCHYMTKYGACSWNNDTKTTCPRTCGICSVECPNIEASKRRDCGHYGITYLDCYHKGCCWSPLEQNSKYPWCFYPEGVSEKDLSDEVTPDEKCEDTNEWCHYHTQRGGCHISDFTKKVCRKSCNLCWMTRWHTNRKKS